MQRIYNKVNEKKKQSSVIRYLSIKQTVYKIDQHFIFKTKKLGDSSRNPRFHNIHLHFGYIHLTPNQSADVRLSLPQNCVSIVKST